MHFKEHSLIVEIVIIFIIISLFFRWILPNVNTPRFQSLVERLHYFGPLIVMSYIVLAHIFAPVSGTPAVLLGISVFGIFEAMLYLYIASLISASIGFYISRHLGKEWVKKLAGKKTLHEIDTYIGAVGVKSLIVGRVIGFAIFDIISYAAGFTNVSFRQFFAVTAIFSLIPMAGFTYFFRTIDFTQPLNLFIWLASTFVIGIVFVFFARHQLGKRLRSHHEKD